MLQAALADLDAALTWTDEISTSPKPARAAETAREKAPAAAEMAWAETGWGCDELAGQITELRGACW
ncbi:hypothetical protein ACWDWV_12580 [Streptosporangium sandarakinum]